MTAAQKAFITAARANIKSDSAREVAAHIAAPVMQAEQRTRAVTKDAATLAWEQASLPEIESFLEVVTGTKANALARLAAINSAQMLAAVRGGKKAKPDKGQEINDRSDALILLYLDAQRRGYDWPLPLHFGQASYEATETVQTPGPSLWESSFPGEPVPTLEAVAEAMT